MDRMLNVLSHPNERLHTAMDFSLVSKRESSRHREASSSFSITQQKGTESNTNFIEMHLGETDQRYYHVHITLRHCSLRGSVHGIHR